MSAILLTPVSSTFTRTKFPEQGEFAFPVAPPTVTLGYQSGFEQRDIVGLGNIAHAGGKQPVAVRFSTILPAVYEKSLCRGIHHPNLFVNMWDARDLLRNLLDNSDIVWLLVGERTGYVGNRPVDETIKGKGTFGQRCYVDSVEFRETHVMFLEVDITFKTVGDSPHYEPVNIRVIPTRQALKPREDLRRFTIRVLGQNHAALWKRIAAANNVDVDGKVKSGPKKGKRLTTLVVPEAVIKAAGARPQRVPD